MEALAAGVPILTTPVGGTEEAAIYGLTGFKAEDATTEALVVAFRGVPEMPTGSALNNDSKLQATLAIIYDSENTRGSINRPEITQLTAKY